MICPRGLAFQAPRSEPLPDPPRGEPWECKQQMVNKMKAYTYEIQTCSRLSDGCDCEAWFELEIAADDGNRIRIIEELEASIDNDGFVEIEGVPDWLDDNEGGLFEAVSEEIHARYHGD